jgi:hypothetical protein
MIATLNGDHALRLAHDRMNEHRAQADAERLARAGRSSGRLAALVAGIRAAFSTPDADRTVVPLLNDYPYRS